MSLQCYWFSHYKQTKYKESSQAEMNNFVKAFKRFNRFLVEISQDSWELVFMQPLNQLISSIQSPFVESDVLKEETSSKATYRSKRKNLCEATLYVDCIACGTLGNPDVAKLKTLAKPSPFGRGNETVYDESVRKACEIEANRISFNDFEDIEDFLIPLIKRIKTPRFMKMKLRMYKLNIYEEGGFFDEHIDTLHGSKHFATFLLCLPRQHEGGALLVSHERETKRIEFDKLSSDNHSFQWACFFTDCVHKVEPVTKGARVLIQFDVNLVPLEKGYSVYEEVVEGTLYNREQEKESEVMEKEIQCNSIYLEKISSFLEEVLAKGINSSSIVPIGKEEIFLRENQENKNKRIQPQGIAFLLRHMYHSEALTSDLLKGSDDILFRHLSSCPRFRVSLTPIILSCSNYLDCDDDAVVRAEPFPKEIQMMASGLYKENEKSDTKNEEDKEEEKIEEEKDLIYVVPGSKEESLNLIKHVDGAEHTGNEGLQEENYYFAGAMIVKLKH